jgi:hypothetical protein
LIKDKNNFTAEVAENAEVNNNFEANQQKNLLLCALSVLGGEF